MFTGFRRSDFFPWIIIILFFFLLSNLTWFQNPFHALHSAFIEIFSQANHFPNCFTELMNIVIVSLYRFVFASPFSGSFNQAKSKANYKWKWIQNCGSFWFINCYFERNRDTEIKDKVRCAGSMCMKAQHQTWEHFEKCNALCV